jgi:pimeloyl-ACP methyl ester carboxylesterase
LHQRKGTELEIDTLEAVQIGGVTQWIRIRGRNAANPALLLMQQGPGLPIINEARGFGRLLGLEDIFTVIYWDQRGTGLSARGLRSSADDLATSAEQAVEDTASMLELLYNRFHGKVFIAGFSFGATIAAQAAVRRPDHVAALVATGIDIDIPFAENHTYDFVLRSARQQGNRRAIRQLEAIGPPPHLDVRQFATRARWAANFGGVTVNADFGRLLRTMLISLLRSPDYSPVDVIRAVRGIAATQAALLAELAATNLVDSLPRLDVPIVIAQGRLDQVAPGESAQRFYECLAAPAKELVWFEKSAHTPQYDEPAKFRDLLVSVRSNNLAGIEID